MRWEVIERCIWIFCIVVLLTMSFRIIIHAEDLSCDKCTITFNDKTVTESKLTEKFTAKVEELFYPYIYEDICVVSWDPVNGFISVGLHEGEPFDV